MNIFRGKYQKLIKYLFWTWLIFILLVSSIPKLPETNIYLKKSFLRLDYLLHFLEYFLLVCLFTFWKAGNKVKINIVFIFFVLFCAIVLGTLDEYHQKFIPGRRFNPWDMFYNYLGVISGILFSILYIQNYLVKKRKTKNSK
jgi:VanZ family protein